MFNKIKRFFRLPVGICSGYAHLKYVNNSYLLWYVQYKALELCHEEGVSVFYISTENINQCSKLEEVQNPACGKFVYHAGKKVNKVLDRIECYPRIEIDESLDLDSGIYVLLHEMGHYFLYKNGEQQSEEKADYYIYTFFKEHLPPFFLWVFQIGVRVRVAVDLKFNCVENYKLNKEAKLFLKNNEK